MEKLILEALEIKPGEFDRTFSQETEELVSRETREPLLRMALFHAYDGMLHADWGASGNGMLAVMAAETKLFQDHIYVANVSHTTPAKMFFVVAAKVWAFLRAPEGTYPQHCMLNLGTSKHSTKMLLTKYAAHFRVVYVNTGDGVNPDTYDSITDNNVTYYNLVRQAVVKNDRAAEFCNALLPLLYACYILTPKHARTFSKTMRMECYMFLMTNRTALDLELPSEIAGLLARAYYEETFGAINPSPYAHTLALLEKFHDLSTPYVLPSADALRSFLVNWNAMTMDPVSNPPTLCAYFARARSIIAFQARGQDLYITPQASGSCTFMSIMVACLVVCVFQAEQDLSYLDFYNNVTSLGHSVLQSMVYTSKDVYNLTSGPVVLQNLLHDGIITQDNSFFKGLQNKTNLLLLPSVHQPKQKYVHRIPTDTMQQLADAIRAQSLTWADIAAQCESIITTALAADTASPHKENYYVDVILLYVLQKLYDPENNDLDFSTYAQDSCSLMHYIRFNVTEDEHRWLCRNLNDTNNSHYKQLFEGGIALVPVLFESMDFYSFTLKLFNLFSYNNSDGIDRNVREGEEWYTAEEKQSERRKQKKNITTLNFLSLCCLGGDQRMSWLENQGGTVQSATYIYTYVAHQFQRLQGENDVFKHADKTAIVAAMLLITHNSLHDDVVLNVAACVLHAVLKLCKNPNTKPNDKDMITMLSVLPLVHPGVYVVLEPVFEIGKHAANSVRVKLLLNTADERAYVCSVLEKCVVSGRFQKHRVATLNFDLLSSVQQPALTLEHGNVFYTDPVTRFVLKCEPVQFHSITVGAQYAGLFATNHMYICDLPKSHPDAIPDTDMPTSLLLLLLPRWTYKSDLYPDADWLVTMTVKRRGKLTIDFPAIPTITINQRPVKAFLSPFRTLEQETELLQQYPFLCVVPKTCNALVTVNENTNAVSVFMLHHNIESGCFAGAFFSKQKYEDVNYRLEVQIQNSFLLPQCTAAESKMLKTMAKNSKGIVVPKISVPGPRIIDRNSGAFSAQPCPGIEYLNKVKFTSVYELVRKFVKEKDSVHTEPRMCVDSSKEVADAVRVVNSVLIQPALNKLQAFRMKTCAALDFGKGANFLEFLMDPSNANTLLQLLQCNTEITVLLRIYTILAAWQTMDCYELRELDELFLNRHEPCVVAPLDAAFQIVFGNLIRPDQWAKYYELVEAFFYGECTVFQFMMGKGKSALITPMLLHHIYRAKAGAVLHMVVPAHLNTQTKATLAPFVTLLGLQVNVVTDTDVKHALLQARNAGLRSDQSSTNVTFSRFSVFLYDEIDDMYDASKSTLNIVLKQHVLAPDTVAAGFQLGLNAVSGALPATGVDSPFAQEFMHIFNNTALKRNTHFGMSRVSPQYRFAIPYEKRLDSPLEGSRFSSPMYTLVLTFRYFCVDGGFFIEQPDVRKICEANDPERLEQLAAEWGVHFVPEELPLTSLLRVLHASANARKQVSPEFMRAYFGFIMLDVTVPDTVYNCSFVDAMNVKDTDALWQVGYSGTVNMNLSMVPYPYQRFLNTIVSDPDEAKGVARALAAAHVYDVPSQETLWRLVAGNRYTAVIDGCAFLEGLTNEQVARKLLEVSQPNGVREVVYLTSADAKMSLVASNPAPTPYVNRRRESGSVLYFYSQRHIVGIDFQQPAILKGLLLLGPQNTRTQAAQAMYRLRKLNRGHTIDVGACFGFSNGDGSTLAALESAELSERLENDTLLAVQYVKYLQRKNKAATDNCYAESNSETVEAHAVVSATLIENKLKEILHVLPVNNMEAAAEKVMNNHLTNSTPTMERAYNALFGQNNNACTNVNTNTATATQTSTSVTVNRAMFQLLNTFKRMKLIMTVYCWWLEKNARPVLTPLFTIVNGADTIHFSRNLCGITHGTACPRTFVLVQLATNTFLVESVESLPAYLASGYPLIAVSSGQIINNFPPFLTRPHAVIDVHSLLYVRCVKAGGSYTENLDIHRLFNLHPNLKTQPTPTLCTLQNDEYTALAFLFCNGFLNEEIKITAESLVCIESAVAEHVLHPDFRIKALLSFSSYLPYTSSNYPQRNLYGVEEVPQSHKLFNVKAREFLRPFTYGIRPGTNYREIVMKNSFPNVAQTSDETPNEAGLMYRG
jgi:hypothetical protein